MSYRGYTADTVTGAAVELMQAYRAVGLSEAAALRQAVDDTVPLDGFDRDVTLQASFLGPDRAVAAVVRENGGGTEADARVEHRRRFHEADARQRVSEASGPVPPTQVEAVEQRRRDARRSKIAAGMGPLAAVREARAEIPDAPPPTAPPPSGAPQPARVTVAEAERQVMGAFGVTPHDRGEA